MIDKLIRLTQDGKLQWQQNGDSKSLFFSPINAPELKVSCYRPECYMEYDGERTGVECEELQRLCVIIHSQITTHRNKLEQFVDLLCKKESIQQ